MDASPWNDASPPSEASTDAGATDGPSSEAGTSEGGAPSCVEYCTLIAANCTKGELAYASATSCADLCALWPLGTLGDMMNTVGCRQREAELAKADPKTHCKPAGPTGDDVCGPSHCANFCALVLSQCGALASPPYPDETSCEADCAGYAYLADAGDATNLAGDSLNCRVYYLESTFDDAGVADCFNTGPASPSLQFKCD